MHDTAFISKLHIDARIQQYVHTCARRIAGRLDASDAIADYNQMKVLAAMQAHRLSDRHFAWNTGYGYNDEGREVTEAIYATVFGAEAALARPIIVSGTHALTLMLTGILKPKARLISITGRPYDTLEALIGVGRPSHPEGDFFGEALMDWGIDYLEIPLSDTGTIDIDALSQRLFADAPAQAALDRETVIYIQRSSGYAWRSALTLQAIEAAIAEIKRMIPHAIFAVDNCYGEFLEVREPLEIGADIMAGSLIKNPGGGLALSGGYVAGKAHLVERVSRRMTSPGIGAECGLTFGQTRPILQGFFMAPSVVGAALKGAMLCAEVYQSLGFSVNPGVEDARSDIIQAIELGSPEAVIAFCRGIQSASPVDSFVHPEPWAMPGYSDDVIMAAGAFVQGSSIELSADAPIRPPYIVYYQGGLTYAHAKIGVMKSLQALRDAEIPSLQSRLAILK